VSDFVTLDGVMEAPGGEEGLPHTGWVPRYPLGLADTRTFESGVVVQTHHPGAS
jgi:hypothetical protein